MLTLGNFVWIHLLEVPIHIESTVVNARAAANQQPWFLLLELAKESLLGIIVSKVHSLANVQCKAGTQT